MNNDTISRSALEKTLVKHYGEDDRSYDAATALTAVQLAPTIDAVPVVRCRCCKHAKTAVSHPQWNCSHAQSPCYRRRVRGIDYCAYGEKWTGSDGEEEE